MESPRDRRLRSDFRALTTLKTESSIVDFKAYGNPPERYLVTLQGAGLRRDDPGAGHPKASILNLHQVEIYLGADYPRNRPQLQWKTEIFHPNISGTGLVCLGGYSTHWVPSLNLDELVEMLWDMVRFANFDVKSPYNLVAARWVASQSEFKFPLDKRPVRDRGPATDKIPVAELGPQGAKPAAAAPSGKPAAPVKPAAGPKPGSPSHPPREAPAAPPPRPTADQEIVFLDADSPAGAPSPPKSPGKPGTRPPTPPKPPDDDILIIR